MERFAKSRTNLRWRYYAYFLFFFEANLAFMVLWTLGSLVHGERRTLFVSTLGIIMDFFLF